MEVCTIGPFRVDRQELINCCYLLYVTLCRCARSQLQVCGELIVKASLLFLSSFIFNIHTLVFCH